MVLTLSGNARGGSVSIRVNKTGSGLVKASFFSVKKLISGHQQTDDQRPDQFCRSLISSNAAGHSQPSSFLAEEQPRLLSCVIIDRPVAIPATAVLKGYLLHLFPSHYFW